MLYIRFLGEKEDVYILFFGGLFLLGLFGNKRHKNLIMCRYNKCVWLRTVLFSFHFQYPCVRHSGICVQ